MKFVLFAIFITTSWAHAGTGSFGVEGFNALCKQGNDLYLEARRITTETCKEQMRSLECAEYFRENEISVDYQRNCDDGPVEMIVDIADGFWNRCPAMLRGDDLPQSSSQIFKRLEENGLVEQPSPLARKHERAEKYRQAIRDSVDYLSLPIEEKRRLFDEAEAERQRLAATYSVVNSVMDQVGVVMGCYNHAKRTELTCYGLAMALNFAVFIPLTGTKAAVTGVRSMGSSGWREKLANFGRAIKTSPQAFTWQGSLPKAAGFKSAGPTDYVANAMAKVKTKLGVEPVMTATNDRDFIKITAMHPQFKTTDLAFLEGDLVSGGTTLNLTKMNVQNADNFKKGMGELVLADTLARYPKIQKIRGVMSDENLKVMNRAYIHTKDCIAAVMATPAYKIRAKVGFAKITNAVCEPKAGVWEFTVERGR